MRYKVQGCIIPDTPQEDELIEPFSVWLDAGSHLESAAMFILEYPKVNSARIWVVDEDYTMFVCPLEHAKLRADYIVGLRTYDKKT
jgi:hypothetical protein|tara:strand:+ start:336 stop:593 length:258 start_codon:yes stop_codon:yes gene_type:complete